MLLYNQITSLDKIKLRKTMQLLLKEDVPCGDPTTEAIIPPNQTGRYILRSREELIFCGGPIIESTFSKLVTVRLLVKEGQKVNVKLIGFDRGKMKLSIKALTENEE